jgi:hypothetical protein
MVHVDIVRACVHDAPGRVTASPRGRAGRRADVRDPDELLGARGDYAVRRRLASASSASITSQALAPVEAEQPVDSVPPKSPPA